MSAQPIIVGGGVAGLAAGYQFAREGRRARIFDERPAPGGVVRTAYVDGCVLEEGPDSFLAAKPAALELIREVGLGGEVIASNDHQRVTYIVKRGRLVAMPDGLMMMVPTRILPMVRSSLLSWGTKARMGLEYFRGATGGPAEDRTVADFIRDHYGQETVDYLAEPLLSGVYGGTADALSINSVLPRFVELERKYGSLTRGVLAARKAAKGAESGPLFLTLKGGLQQLVDRLAPDADYASARVEALERNGAAWRVRAGGGWQETDALVLAAPAWAAAELLAPTDARLAELLRAVDYSSSLTMALGFRRADCGPLPPGFGFLVPRPEGRSLVACTFVQAKFNHRAPEGIVVLRCFLGGAGRESILERADEELVETVQDELENLLGWRAKPAFKRLARWPRAMAQYTVGHGKRVEEIRARVAALPGLKLAGNAYDGIGIPDCIRLGRAAARELLSTAASP